MIPCREQAEPESEYHVPEFFSLSLSYSTKDYAAPALGSSKSVFCRSLAPKHLLGAVVGNHHNVHLQFHAFFETRHIEQLGEKYASQEMRGDSALRCCAVAPQSGRVLRSAAVLYKYGTRMMLPLALVGSSGEKGDFPRHKVYSIMVNSLADERQQVNLVSFRESGKVS